MTEMRPKLEQNLVGGVLLLLLAGCLIVLWPFATALLWAIVLSFSTWPLYCRFVAILNGRQTLAALLLSLGMVVAVVMPLGIVGLTIGDNVREYKAAARRWLDNGPPTAPAWLVRIPVVGRTAAGNWNNLAGDSAKFTEKVKDSIEPVGAWVLKTSLKLGVGLGQLALSILLTFFFLRHGAALGGRLKGAVLRIGGDRGTHLLEVAGDTVRGVVYGILGTAMVQAFMAGFGFVIAGVPGAGLLALLTFFLSAVPFGPPLISFPAAFWLFNQGSTGWGIFMLIWGVLVSTIDNFVKPWLISQGSDMPFLLILFGVLGGALAFGFIGIFIGPTLLAVGYRIVEEWLATVPSSDLGLEQTEGTLQPVSPRDNLFKT